jgi:hypothetical protein
VRSSDSLPASAQRTTIASAPVLRVGGVAKSFHRGPPWHRRTVEVLRGASLNVEGGELVGLVGENGSGKSTLMQIMVGMLARDGGTVQRPERLGYCPQLPLLWEKLTVAEHFELSGRAYGLGDTESVASRQALLAELQFAKYLDCRVEELSGAEGTRNSTSHSRFCTRRSCCCSTSPTRALTGRPTCASGRWPSAAGPRAWASSSSATCSRSATAHSRVRAARRPLPGRMTRAAAFARE